MVLPVVKELFKVVSKNSTDSDLSETTSVFNNYSSLKMSSSDFKAREPDHSSRTQ